MNLFQQKIEINMIASLTRTIILEGLCYLSFSHLCFRL